MKILQKWKNKALLALKTDDENIRNVCRQVIKDEIDSIRPTSVVRPKPGQVLVAYLDVGRLPIEKANQYCRKMYEHFTKFFDSKKVLILPIRSIDGGGQTRMEYIDVDEYELEYKDKGKINNDTI